MTDYNTAVSCTDGMHVGCFPLPHVDICCLLQSELQNLFTTHYCDTVGIKQYVPGKYAMPRGITG